MGSMNEVQAVSALAALAHPARLQVFRSLVAAGQEGLTPGLLQQELGIPATTLSFHLKELSRAGLAASERASRNLVYRAEYAQMNSLLAYLTENCCQGVACATVETAAARGC
jgi:ArsR family transcriptional regulator, arsenate/arsenite/antimonite-responsive transcriptional repressor